MARDTDGALGKTKETEKEIKPEEVTKKKGTVEETSLVLEG